MDFSKAIQQRRSIYGLGKSITISNERIKELVEESVLHSPSAFHSQSARVVVLFNEHHTKFWGIVSDNLKKIVPTEAFPKTEEKINSFSAAYGTVLFFEDNGVVKGLQEQFSLYKDNFPVWSQQASGILQFVVWTSLEIEGLGASLQHYNPLIDDNVKKQWDIPESWSLIAQMPFGEITAKASEKTFAPLSDRIKYFG